MNNRITKYSVIIMAVLLLAAGCNAKQKPANISSEGVLSPGYWKSQALTDIIPFWEGTIDEENGGFYTDVEPDGSVWGPGNKFPRMNSRAVFGFTAAYMLSGDEKYLELAAHGMEYLSEYGWDHENGGWHTYTDEENEPDSYGKNLFDETYGNLGPVYYFFATGDSKALSLVSRTHSLLREKAWDKENGGYYAKMTKDWSISTTNKSFNSQIDTCTAYLIYYYLATRDAKLLSDLTELADAVVSHMVDPKTGFVGEYFDRKWKWLEEDLWAGHNLKTGWVLMRVYFLTGDKKYLQAAQKIAKAQMKYTWDNKYGGWLFRFMKDDPSSVSTEKDWWTQEEGNMLMLNMYKHNPDKEYIDKLEKCSNFWDAHFIDKKHGECWSTLTRSGAASRKVKADYFKSAYHTMEQALFSCLYLSLYVHKKDAELYFRLSAEKQGKKHYVVPVESPDVIIKSVEIDGKKWDKFNPQKGFITLPAGKNMKIKVTYSI